MANRKAAMPQDDRDIATWAASIRNELARIKSLPAQEGTVALAALAVVPAHPERIAYTVLRELFLDRFGEFMRTMWEFGSTDDWVARVFATQKKMKEVEVWLRPPFEPLTAEKALKLVEGSKSEIWRDAVLSSIGKRPKRGQPASKRHLAVKALDMKCAYPALTLRDATDTLCPCGKGVGHHSDKCREQLRQQINRLVKFLKSFGHNFTWERIGASGWKESS